MEGAWPRKASEGLPSTDNLSELSGRDLTSSSQVQARITGPPGDYREEGRGGEEAAYGMGLSHKCRVGDYNSWKEEGK